MQGKKEHGSQKSAAIGGTVSDMRSRILAHLAGRSYRPQRVRPLARSMGIVDDEYPSFREAVKELMKAGRVVLGGGNVLMLPESQDLIVGTYRGHPRGFGFVVPDSPAGHGDLFIPPGASLGALTGDRVAARLTRRRRRPKDSTDRLEGEIVEIYERSTTQCVGELVRLDGRWCVRPDGHVLHAPIEVPDAPASRARPGDQVVVELTEYPLGSRRGRGVIVKVLGPRSAPGVDTQSICCQYNLPGDFPEAVKAEARERIARYSLDQELRRRADLRDLTVITIDPEDARDYDDAISLVSLDNGQAELGVHIADVSAFVPPGGALDTEAALRGNSVYLPGMVIPMLPEVLSNGLCSLQEGQPRLTKSVFIRYDRHGRRVSTRFTDSVICSTRRLTYRQASAVLERRLHQEPPDVVSLLRRMDALARLIRKRRLAAGMIVLDLPEIELVLDEQGRVTDVEPADTSFSHTIIEMFMVEANEAVAELLRRTGVPHLRRLHPPPPPDAVSKLGRILRVLGQSVPGELDRPAILRLLNSVRGKPQAFMVHLAVLRSMGKAVYSPRLEGHYALASEDYCHFTSPIRRYPDLLVHRLLGMYLGGELRRDRRLSEKVPSRERLEQIGQWCSYTEQRAEMAERELRMVKLLGYLESRLGEMAEGIVTGVTQVGVFVQLQPYLIEGLIRFADLPDDWWVVDAEGGCVRGQTTGRRIAIGDVVRVQLARIDLSSRELDLVLPADESWGRGTGRGRLPAGPAPSRRSSGRRGAGSGRRRR